MPQGMLQVRDGSLKLSNFASKPIKLIEYGGEALRAVSAGLGIGRSAAAPAPQATAIRAEPAVRSARDEHDGAVLAGSR